MSENNQSDPSKNIRMVNINVTDIIDGYFNDTSLSGENKPKLVVIIGGTGSGKTTIRKNDYSADYVLIDAGDIFKKICKGNDIDYEFGEDFLAATEAIGQAVANRAMKERRNIVIEIIGNNYEEGIKQIIDSVLGCGYETEIKFIACDDIAEAYRRHVEGSTEFLSAAFTESYQMRWLVEATKNGKNKS